MEGFSLYFWVLFIISFINILLCIVCLLKIIELKINSIILTLCALITTILSIGTDFFPFVSFTNAIITFSSLAAFYAGIFFFKTRNNNS